MPPCFRLVLGVPGFYAIREGCQGFNQTQSAGQHSEQSCERQAPIGDRDILGWLVLSDLDFYPGSHTPDLTYSSR